MHPAPIALVVFDLDGTLVDSRRDLADSANLLLADFGAPPLSVDEVTGMVGDGARVLIERVFAARQLGAPPDAARLRFSQIYAEHVDDHTVPYEGVHEMLAALAVRCTMAVLTNKPQRHTDVLLERLGLDRGWHHIVGAENGFARKPDPAGLNWLVAQTRSTPDTTLMVGDSRNDLLTARAAGTRLCLARYGFGFAQLAAGEIRDGDAIVDAPLEIVGLCG